MLRLEVKCDLADPTRWVVGIGILQATVIIGVLRKVAKLI